MRGNLRKWWLLVILLALLNTLVWQRPRIATWTATRALAAASNDDGTAAQRWIDYSQMLDPDAPLTEVALARTERRSGEFDQSKRHLNRASYLGADAELIEMERWLSIAQSGAIQRAKSQLPNLLESAGNDVPEVCEAYAIGFMRMRDFGSALALLDGWAIDYPDDPRPYSWMGHIYAELQNTPAAEKAFRQSLAIDSLHGPAALGLGRLLTDTKQTAAAIPFLKIAFENPKLQSKATVPLATALRSQSQSEEADRVLQESLANHPEDHAILVERANSLVEQGEFESAANLLQPLIETETLRREVHYAYATALRGLGKLEDATKHFEYATTAATALAEANRKISSVSENPEDIDLRFQIGKAHLVYGNLEDGILWLQSVLQIAPSHVPTHQALADYYQRKSETSPKYISLAQHHRQLAGPEEAAAQQTPTQQTPTQQTPTQQTPTQQTPTQQTAVGS